jgi:hypothetical protein
MWENGKSKSVIRKFGQLSVRALGYHECNKATNADINRFHNEFSSDTGFAIEIHYHHTKLIMVIGQILATFFEETLKFS